MTENNVKVYEKHRPSILSALAKLGGLLALLKISSLIQIIHRKLYRNAVKQDDLGEDVTEKYSIEKMNEILLNTSQTSSKLESLQV